MERNEDLEILSTFIIFYEDFIFLCKIFVLVLKNVFDAVRGELKKVKSNVNLVRDAKE